MSASVRKPAPQVGVDSCLLEDGVGEAEAHAFDAVTA